MLSAGFVRSIGLALAVCAASFNASAQQAQPPASSSTYQPSVGQEGKDVVWVPTPQALVDKMLDMAKVTASDFVMDLGSGDGRTVITAAKRGAQAMGIEYNPDMVEMSRAAAAQEGVTARAKFEKADLFDTDLSKATVITMFLLPEINLKLRPKILDLKPGTRVVSNTFTMGEWTPDETFRVTDGCGTSWCTALLWIVPAKVNGDYKIPQGDLTLRQKFQMVSGTLKSDGKSVPVEGKVVGDQIRIKAGGKELRGKVDGKRIQMQ